MQRKLALLDFSCLHFNLLEAKMQKDRDPFQANFGSCEPQNFSFMKGDPQISLSKGHLKTSHNR
jgi:hypothetical protein